MPGITKRVLKAFNLHLRGGRQRVPRGACQLDRNRRGGVAMRKAFNRVEWIYYVSPGTALSPCFRQDQCLDLNLEAFLSFFMAWLNSALVPLSLVEMKTA